MWCLFHETCHSLQICHRYYQKRLIRTQFVRCVFSLDVIQLFQHIMADGLLKIWLPVKKTCTLICQFQGVKQKGLSTSGRKTSVKEVKNKKIKKKALYCLALPVHADASVGRVMNLSSDEVIFYFSYKLIISDYIVHICCLWVTFGKSQNQQLSVH